MGCTGHTNMDAVTANTALIQPWRVQCAKCACNTRHTSMAGTIGKALLTVLALTELKGWVFPLMAVQQQSATGQPVRCIRLTVILAEAARRVSMQAVLAQEWKAEIPQHGGMGAISQFCCGQHLGRRLLSHMPSRCQSCSPALILPSLYHLQRCLQGCHHGGSQMGDVPGNDLL